MSAARSLSCFAPQALWLLLSYEHGKYLMLNMMIELFRAHPNSPSVKKIAGSVEASMKVPFPKQRQLLNHHIFITHV